MIYVHCQCSVSMCEIVCPLCCKGDCSGCVRGEFHLKLTFAFLSTLYDLFLNLILPQFPWPRSFREQGLLKKSLNVIWGSL